MPLPRIYSDLADWFHLLTAPEEYAHEAEYYTRLIREASATPPRTMLELGSGGGNNASHMKADFDLTLTDLSPGMLELSKTINPELEHIAGDMRTLRLGRVFDAVFVHDAVVYMRTENDLRAAMETAFVHTKPGGVALFAPDFLGENFRPGTDHGGHDGADGRALRYLEWVYDPDPSDTVYTVHYALLLREADGTVRVDHDQHEDGLFSRLDWLRLFGEVGFHARSVTTDDPEVAGEVFVCVRPASS
jgi:SAM-dependent methyltransferase